MPEVQITGGVPEGPGVAEAPEVPEASEAEGVQESAEDAGGSEETTKPVETTDDDSEAFTVHGKQIKLTKAQQKQAIELNLGGHAALAKAAKEVKVARSETEDLKRELGQLLQPQNRTKLRTFLEHSGVDVLGFAEEILDEAVSFSKMSKEERSRHEEQVRIRRENEELRQALEQKEKQGSLRSEKEEIADFERRYPGALEAAGLPDIPETKRRMAYYVGLADEKGKDVDYAKIAEHIASTMEEEMNEVAARWAAKKTSKQAADQTEKVAKKKIVANLSEKKGMAQANGGKRQPLVPVRKTYQEHKSELYKRLGLS